MRKERSEKREGSGELVPGATTGKMQKRFYHQDRAGVAPNERCW